jgi:Arsenical pump membrane protein
VVRGRAIGEGDHAEGNVIADVVTGPQFRVGQRDEVTDAPAARSVRQIAQAAGRARAYQIIGEQVCSASPRSARWWRISSTISRRSWSSALFAAGSGHAAIAAALVGVNVGPNLTYAGSLATLLWRRLLKADDVDVNLGQFLRLGVLTVPAALAASTLLLWTSVRVGL